jgi:hypothetical protein
MRHGSSLRRSERTVFLYALVIDLSTYLVRPSHGLVPSAVPAIPRPASARVPLRRETPSGSS